MKKLVLEKAWTFRTPQKTIDFAKGDHEVTDAVYAAAVADGMTTESGDNASGPDDGGSPQNAAAVEGGRGANRAR